jgi:signal transduction histidine kinase
MAVHTPPPRTRSARLTLLSLLLIPLLSLAALWGFTASITLGNVIRDQHYNTVVSTVDSSVAALEQALTAERTLTVVWLDTDRRSPQAHAQLLAARRGTDTYAAEVRGSVTSVRRLLGAVAQAQLDGFLSDLAGLPGIRAEVDSGADTAVAAFNAYGAISTAEFGFFHNATPPNDPDFSLLTQASIAGNRAEDFTNGAIALVSGALAARGQMTQPERVLFAEVFGQQNAEVAETLSLAAPAVKSLFGQVFDSPAYGRLVTEENQVASTSGNQPIPVPAAAFEANAKAVQAVARSTLVPIGEVLAAQSARLSDNLQTELFLVGGLGLVAVLASVFVAVRFGRRLRVELASLYESARQMADERLPRLVGRLHRGEDVDVQAESPPLRAGRITEIANIAHAFSSVQRTAVEAAVGQASLRKGVSQVFVSLSLRSQSLLHRQLAMLDAMERATSDSAVLADLFRLDHVTTRMRRHAEGLLILAGTTPGRGWRDPVPAVDVLNAAVAEVEDYVRVDVVSESQDAVAGTAVNDVIHLLAELIENATAFSPPHTRVEIRGDAVGHGFAVEIEDRGLGMSAEELADVNARMASPPEFDLANTDQLGLFLAARLAARHGIRVSLRQSSYGGTAAIVVLPHAIIVSGHDVGAVPETGSGVERPSATANGSAREAGHAGNGRTLPVFGLTGRHRLSSSPEHGRAVPSATGSPVSTAGALASPGRPELPQRVRQASLAPQLRDWLSSGSTAPRQEEVEPQARSPEEAGGVMAALQAGWQQGRHDDLDYLDAGPDGWPGDAFGTEAEPDEREVDP